MNKEDLLEFELGDSYIQDIVREQHLFQTAIQETRERLLSILSPEEMGALQLLVMNKLTPLQLAQSENNTILLALLK